jgi:hypothetical protein
MRSKLIDAKIDQLTKTIVISRATHRVFGADQWKDLQNTVSNWKTDLEACLQVLQ